MEGGKKKGPTYSDLSRLRSPNALNCYFDQGALKSQRRALHTRT